MAAMDAFDAETAALIDDLILDYFAFEAAARGPEDPDEGDRITPEYDFTNDAYYDLSLRCAHGEAGSEDCESCNLDGRW